MRRRIHATSPGSRSKPFAEDYLYYDDNVDVETIKRHTNETDDYAFLDEDENMEDEDVMVPSPNALSGGGYRRRTSNPRSRQKRDIRSEFHVVFKRKDSQLDHVSDYSTCLVVSVSKDEMSIQSFTRVTK